MRFLHFLLIVLVILLSVALTAPALAQETPAATQPVAATPAPAVEQPPVIVEVPPVESSGLSRTDVVQIGVIFLLAVILIFKEYTIRDYIRQAFASIPPEGRLLLLDGGTRLLSEGQKLVDATPNKADDALYAMLLPVVQRIILDVYPGAPPSPPPPDSKNG